MSESSEDRLETLHQVYDVLSVLLNPKSGEIEKPTVDQFHRQLDRLETLGLQVDPFGIPSTEWKPSRMDYRSNTGLAIFRTGPVEHPGSMVIGKSTFQDYVQRAGRFVERQIRHKESAGAAAMSSVDGVIKERRRVLSTLIDAYVTNQQTIMTRRFVGEGLTFYHPAIPKGFTTEWSNIEALAHDGKLIVTRSPNGTAHHISIPTSVLSQLHREEAGALNTEPGTKRVEAIEESGVIHQYFFGGSHNIAQNSREFTQSLNLGFQPGDLDGLVRYLRAHGLTDRGEDELRSAALADEQESGHRSYGDRLSAFVGRIAADATGELIAGGALQMLPLVAGAITEYVR